MIRPAADVLYREVDGEGVLLNLVTGTYFGLNPVGSRVWQLIKDGHQPDAICDMLLREYEVGIEQLRADVLKLVEQLIEEKLLVQVGSRIG